MCDGYATVFRGDEDTYINQWKSYPNSNNGYNYFALNGVPQRSLYFIGCIGQVEIYSSALSYNAVRERYEAMLAGITTAPTTAPSMVTDIPTQTPSNNPTNAPTYVDVTS